MSVGPPLSAIGTSPGSTFEKSLAAVRAHELPWSMLLPPSLVMAVPVLPLFVSSSRPAGSQAGLPSVPKIVFSAVVVALVSVWMSDGLSDSVSLSSVSAAWPLAIAGVPSRPAESTTVVFSSVTVAPPYRYAAPPSQQVVRSSWNVIPSPVTVPPRTNSAPATPLLLFVNETLFMVNVPYAVLTAPPMGALETLPVNATSSSVTSASLLNRAPPPSASSTLSQPLRHRASRSSTPPVKVRFWIVTLAG